MKKLLDYDWLRAVQFKCNTSAKYVTPVQNVSHLCKLHIQILDYDWLQDKRKFSKPMISTKIMMKILGGSFLSERKWQKIRSSAVLVEMLSACSQSYP